MEGKGRSRVSAKSANFVRGDMTRITKELDSWPESTEEMLSLPESFDRFQKKHVREYVLKICVLAYRRRRRKSTRF